MSTGRRARRLLLLLLVLFACAAGGESGSVCDVVTCGEANCTELPGGLALTFPPSVPPYECHCDPGWSKVFKDDPISPCMIPDCSFDAACLNLSTPIEAKQNICGFVKCGEGGVCKPNDSGIYTYTCECQPGYTNLINNTALPCAKNDCFSGNICTGLGAPAPSPPGDHGSPPSSAPPSGTKGSVLSLSLLPLLLLISIAMVVQVL